MSDQSQRTQTCPVNQLKHIADAKRETCVNDQSPNVVTQNQSKANTNYLRHSETTETDLRFFLAKQIFCSKSKLRKFEEVLKSLDFFGNKE